MTRSFHTALAAALGIAASSWGTPWAAADVADIDALRAAAAAPGPECNPEVDPARPQLIVGYGSLMQEESRRQTAPQATSAVPVQVTGYRRGWFAAGRLPGFNAVFLGALPEAAARINAVLFEVPPDEVAALDDREYVYCRIGLPLNSLFVLGGAGPAPGGQAWIYVNQPDSLALPSDDVPIVQAYVDTFLSGCFELEDAHRLAGFARECVTSTGYWSPDWVNDRIHPRHPLTEQPLAGRIDGLLKSELPDDFAAIRIE